MRCYTLGMKFRALQENLRKALWERIDEDELTGLRLARETGFKQAHISNFLNRKRGLSVEGMDKVLNVQRLSILDLLDPGEINKRASIAPPSEDEFDNVLLVNGAVAARQPPLMEGDRENWERCVITRADGREGMSMYPRLLPGATVLIDRHYNSLKPYRKGESNMHAVARNGDCTVKYVEVAGNHLVLRPHNHGYPVEVMAMSPGKKVHDSLIGR